MNHHGPRCRPNDPAEKTPIKKEEKKPAPVPVGAPS